MESYNETLIYNNFNQYFSDISDPRQIAKVKHPLSEIIFITVMAVIAGAEDFEAIALYAKFKKDWLSTFLELPAGIPSHDTFNRVLCAIDPIQFEQCFIGWISCYRDKLPVEQQMDVIAIDGKTICNSADKKNEKKPIHIVSAFSTQYGLILGQQKCYEKSNEITAIPELLSALDIKGTIITIDAMGTQKEIAKMIIDKSANYILALKGNHSNLHKEVIDLFEKIKTPAFEHYIHDQSTEIDKGHGRIETRHCIAIQKLDWLYEPQFWAGLKSIAKVTATVIKNGAETTEDRYYISSLAANAELLNTAIRKHWHIENKLHWVLDVVFNEDYCRVRMGNGAENLSIIRKIALNKMKSDNSMKKSMKSKRNIASWSDSYAIKIMYEMMS